MVRYSLEIKQSAQKELDALRDTLFARITRTSGASGSGTWRVLYIIDDAAKLVTITRIAHRREVYE